MSASINYHHIRPQEAVAEKELAGLLEALSQHGVLRFLTALTGALPHIGIIAARGLNSEASVRTVQNLGALLQALSRVPPQDFAHFLEAVSGSVQSIERETENSGPGNGEPPGITGAYRLLQDDALWHALGPILDGLKAFGAALSTPKRDVSETPRGPTL